MRDEIAAGQESKASFYCENWYNIFLLSQKYIAVLLIILPLLSRWEDLSALLIPLICDLTSIKRLKVENSRWFRKRVSQVLTSDRSKYTCYFIGSSVFLFIFPQVYEFAAEILIRYSDPHPSLLLNSVEILRKIAPAGRIMYSWYISNHSAQLSAEAAINADFQNFCILLIAILNVLLAQRYSRAGYIDALQSKNPIFQVSTEKAQAALQELVIKSIKNFLMLVFVLEFCNYLLSFRFALEVGTIPNQWPLAGSFQQVFMYLVTYFGILTSQWVLVGSLAEAAIVKVRL